MPSPKRNAGFTLLELVIVLSLLGMFFCLLPGAIVYTTAAYSRQSTSQVVESDLRYAMDYMVRELRGAVTVIAIAENDSKIIYTTPLDGPDKTRYFRLRGTSIQRHDNQPISQYVEKMQFSYDAHSERVTISLESVNTYPGATSNKLPCRLYTSVALRNAPHRLILGERGDTYGQ